MSYWTKLIYRQRQWLHLKIILPHCRYLSQPVSVCLLICSVFVKICYTMQIQRTQSYDFKTRPAFIPYRQRFEVGYWQDGVACWLNSRNEYKRLKFHSSNLRQWQNEDVRNKFPLGHCVVHLTWHNWLTNDPKERDIFLNRNWLMYIGAIVQQHHTKIVVLSIWHTRQNREFIFTHLYCRFTNVIKFWIVSIFTSKSS